MKAVFFYSAKQAQLAGVCRIDGQPYTECKTRCFDADPDPVSGWSDAVVVAKYTDLPLDVPHYIACGTHHAQIRHLPIIGKSANESRPPIREVFKK